MRRREFISLLGGATAWPVAARAQPAEAPKRVGVLSSANEGDFRKRFALFHDRLAQLGWIEQRNLRIDFRWTDGKPELGEAYARELVGLAPDAIFVEPGPNAEIIQRLTRTIPVVFITATDPVEAGYVQSYAHPGGNMTGFTAMEATVGAKWLELLKEVAPRVARFRDRLELTDLLNCAVSPFSLGIPLALFGCLYLSRFENRPWAFG